MSSPDPFEVLDELNDQDTAINSDEFNSILEQISEKKSFDKKDYAQPSIAEDPTVTLQRALAVVQPSVSAKEAMQSSVQKNKTALSNLIAPQTNDDEEDDEVIEVVDEKQSPEFFKDLEAVTTPKINTSWALISSKSTKEDDDVENVLPTAVNKAALQMATTLVDKEGTPHPTVVITSTPTSTYDKLSKPQVLIQNIERTLESREMRKTSLKKNKKSKSKPKPKPKPKPKTRRVKSKSKPKARSKTPSKNKSESKSKPKPKPKTRRVKSKANSKKKFGSKQQPHQSHVSVKSHVRTSKTGEKFKVKSFSRKRSKSRTVRQHSRAKRYRHKSKKSFGTSSKTNLAQKLQELMNEVVQYYQ